MNRIILLISIVSSMLFIKTELTAQTATKVHQSFSLNGINNIVIDISYPYVIEPWQGNTILLETSIDIDNAPPTLVRMFQESGRYKVIEKKEDNTIQYKLQPMSRKEVETSKGRCVENILMRFFVPENANIKTLGNLLEEEE